MHGNYPERPKTKDQRPKTKDLSLRAEAGFTLIELSIVIVIIGLIVAGVVGGQALVEQAKLRNVISDIEKIKVAYRTFRLEYDGVPGDFSRAGDYGIGTSVNGNKRIDSYNEGSQSWVHLTNAEIYPGTFTGTVLNPPVPGLNVPEGPIQGTWYRVIPWNPAPRVFGQSRSTLSFNGGNHPWGGATSGKNAYSIDLKIDDGIAHSGILSTARAYNLPGPDVCTLGNAPYSTTSPLYYNLGDTGKNSCWLFFWLEGVVY